MTRVAVCQLAGRTLAEAPVALAACRALVAEAARAGADVAVLPDCFLPEAADKAMAPGTDVFAGRRPSAYGELVSDS